MRLASLAIGMMCSFSLNYGFFSYKATRGKKSNRSKYLTSFLNTRLASLGNWNDVPFCSTMVSFPTKQHAARSWIDPNVIQIPYLFFEHASFHAMNRWGDHERRYAVEMLTKFYFIIY